ncbi:DUF3563 family protein [Chthonobacter albigriseus]|uniref:DUF3563 family protein n=1 Tax=Chthonobacter albigriseus TaxID=1683161 RepID=UPI0015EED499|nr:DUF3563 family protein [Chthonobacter albigriseus]
MFAPLKRAARVFKGMTATERELAYLNESSDRIDLEYRQREIDRGMFRPRSYGF